MKMELEEKETKKRVERKKEGMCGKEGRKIRIEGTDKLKES